MLSFTGENTVERCTGVLMQLSLKGFIPVLFKTLYKTLAPSGAKE